MCCVNIDNSPLWSLSRSRPHVRRTNVEYPVSRVSPLDMDNLIPKDAFLDTIKYNDDIDWNVDPFEYPDHKERESPEEFVVLIHFAGPLAL